MNRRGTRVREYYGYALIAGIPCDKARRMTPGFIMDMFKIRAEYDVRVNGGKIQKRMLGG
jgi:hypothetical protein